MSGPGFEPFAHQQWPDVVRQDLESHREDARDVRVDAIFVPDARDAAGEYIYPLDYTA